MSARPPLAVSGGSEKRAGRPSNKPACESASQSRVLLPVHLERAFLPLVSPEISPRLLPLLSRFLRNLRDRAQNFDLIMWQKIILLCLSVVVVTKEDPLYPSESDPNFMKMFERKYANLVQIDQSKCLQKLTCILAKNESSFEDPVIAHIVRDFESIKTIHSNSPAFLFLAAYQTGLSKQKCEKAYPECPIGFVADERYLDDEEEEVAGAVETDASTTPTPSSKQSEDIL